jgi:hypothetical protein
VGGLLVVAAFVITANSPVNPWPTLAAGFCLTAFGVFVLARERRERGRRDMIRGLRIFGIVWIWAVVALVVVGNIAFLCFAESKLEALGKIRDDMNPFNFSGWLVKLLLASPGLAALWLSERFKPKAGEEGKR